MTPEAFYKRLAQGVDPNSLITLSPGPIRLRIGPQDALAAKLLLWLVEQMPEDATQGDMDDVLESARYWSMFWASLERDGEP